ncbi:hybrid sensor histidine kinase/response regulator [Microcoleus sp. FACHB-1515]|uniref:hybrid sensor histidine kinase/response regulator n=1 Tax=Cyanophyceae TaxID=3028117 RepID=UPI001689AE3B|nr:hybrid sensor histidine kinase/response regulator [Microcoleus sp. FACHB-1515]MBD2092429.1 hybrid sensor histidine kinase/response regulator [Microcoleus sp. FACHB-1515]
MAMNSDIRDQAYQFFVEEAPELLQAIEAELLTLHSERSTAQIHVLMRSAHSLKGGAASVGLETIAAIAHRLENIFKALYSDSIDINSALVSHLLQAYDCLRLPLMEQITTGNLDVEQAFAIAEPVFQEIEAVCGDALTQTRTYIPTSEDMGVDMVASIFEVDVAEGLDRLAAAVANPENHEIAGELRAQIEVFAGFAELLNLPEFGAIAQSIEQALDTSSDALELAKRAIVEFEACRQAVLSKRRSSEKPASVAIEAVPIEIDDPPITAVEGADLEAALLQLDGLEKIFGDAIEQPVSVDDSPQKVEESIEAFTAGSLELTAAIALENLFDDAEIEAIESEIEYEDSALDLASEFSQAETELAQNFAVSSQIDESSFVTEIETASNSHPLIDLEVTEAIETASVDRSLTESVAPALPLLEEDKLLPALQPVQRSSRQAQKGRSRQASASHLTVRVDSSRLEKMNNLVGELAINRDALSLQNDQLQAISRQLLSRFERFQAMVGQLREISDQMLIAPERYGYAATITSKMPEAAAIVYPAIPSATTAEFDPLEMDRYGALHPQFQEILENLVQLEESIDDITLFARQSNQLLDQQRNRLSQLQDEIIWARMLPLSEVVDRFPRMLRDLSTNYGKPVQLTLTGADVLVEKAILEKLHAPLLHLLRNAFDHGIESIDRRLEQGKSEQGQIEIRAYHRGSQTIIEIRDDGQGINLDRIRVRILQLGLLSPEQLMLMQPEQLLEFIFEPGFSTVDRVSELSGRGVGLDIVRSQLRSVKGAVTVRSVPGQGTTFTLALPLTLTITKLIVCLVGSAALALPADSIEEILTPQPTQVKQSGAERLLAWHDQMLPVYRLGDLLAYGCPQLEMPLSKAFVSVPTPTDWALPVLILRQDQQLFALEVDRLITEQELVIKPFGSTIAPPNYLYGCTILADGSLVPIVDAVMLLNFNQVQTQAPQRPPTHLPTPQVPTILVVDDAVTLRRTLALSLERNGFRVLQARDGREAIAQLQKNPFVKLIVCDIEMPNMNGFEFLSHRRQDNQLATIPVVMLTSRSNDKHNWLARQLGATAYFTKPFLEQEFLGEIREILSRSL